MTQILVVEDEMHLAEGLRFNLEAEGYQVSVVETGEAALELLQVTEAPYDVVVLDVMLPGKDGFAVMSELRQSGQFVPTLMLTARGHPEDILKGFGAGADDYLTKPFELAILLAHLRGLLRRRDWLRTPEANLMRYLIQHQGRPVSRKAMLEDVWGLHEDTDTRAIDNFIVRLRRYIEDEPVRPRHLLTIRGVGYRFVASPPVA